MAPVESIGPLDEDSGSVDELVETDVVLLSSASVVSALVVGSVDAVVVALVVVAVEGADVVIVAPGGPVDVLSSPIDIPPSPKVVKAVEVSIASPCEQAAPINNSQLNLDRTPSL